MVKLSDEAKKRKKEYNEKYAKEHFQGKYVTFNKDIPEDIELYNWLKVQPEGGNGYIKRLIRADMEQRRGKKDV